MASEDLRGTLHFTMLYDPVAGILTVRLIEVNGKLLRIFPIYQYLSSIRLKIYSRATSLERRILTQKLNYFPTPRKLTCGRLEFINEHSIQVLRINFHSACMKLIRISIISVFDEDFVFEVRAATLGRRTLEILLYDFDAYSRHVCIGGLKILLAHVDLSDRVELWKSLGPCAEQDAKIELGDLMLSLSYLPSAERLTVVVIKARNLRVFDDTRNSSGTNLFFHKF